MPLAAPLALLALLLVASCGAQQEPPAIVNQVEPSTAYSDAATLISLKGGPFRPPVQIETMSGAGAVGTTPFAVFLDPSPSVAADRSIFTIDPQWLSNVNVTAQILPGLPPGDYTVQMRDPRGQLAVSTAHFLSLGPDIDGPVISFLKPASGMAVGGGAEVSVVAHIDDGPGHVRDARWSVSSPTLGEVGGACLVGDDQPAVVDCPFSFIAPAVTTNLEQIDIRVDAEDSVQNSSSASLPIRVAWRPKLVSVDPMSGPTAGGTPIVVVGQAYVAGLSQILIDGTPIGGLVDDAGIHGTTPPHLAGRAALTVVNGSSASAPLTFTFLAATKIRAVSPTHGPPDRSTAVTVAGNNFSDQTTFFWGQNGQRWPIVPDPPPAAPPPSPLVTFVSESRVVITVPPGFGVISIVADDPIGGESELQNAFTYDNPIP